MCICRHIVNIMKNLQYGYRYNPFCRVVVLSTVSEASVSTSDPCHLNLYRVLGRWVFSWSSHDILRRSLAILVGPCASFIDTRPGHCSGCLSCNRLLPEVPAHAFQRSLPGPCVCESAPQRFSVTAFPRYVRWRRKGSI